MISCIAPSVSRLLPALGAAVALPLILSACGTVSKAECQAGDWYSIGLNDGRNGAAPALFDQHAESCRRYNLPADRTGWEEGRLEGLKSYCTPVSGYATGVAGRTYENVCTGRAAEDFLTGYGIGREVGRARSAVSRLESEQRRIDNEISRVESDISRLRRDLAGTDGERRRAIRDELDQLEFRRLDLRSESFSVSRDLREARREADYAESAGRANFTGTFGYPPI